MPAAKRPPHPDFAERLNAAIEAAAIPAKVIVDTLDVDRETVRLWRRGWRMPSKDKMDILAKLLGRSAAHLRYGEEGGQSSMPGVLTVTDEDERLLLETYRQLPPWGKTSVRARAAELLENFAPKGPGNPFSKAKEPGGGTQ